MKKIIALFVLIVLLAGCTSPKISEDITPSASSEVDSNTVVVEETTEDNEAAFVAETPVVSENPPEPKESLVIDPNSLRALAEEKSMLVGAAVTINHFGVVTYLDTLKNEFNALTLENGMKWASVNPSRTNFVFAGSDIAVNFAIENEMQVRGHTLVWHQQLPLWLTDKKDWTKEELTEVLINYIDNMVGHYKGKIHSWDVLNEIFNEDGTFRESMWYKTMGDEFIALALKKAHEVDPEAKLIINDYSVETINAKSDGLYNLVKKLKEEGVPIDGVGFQSHFISGQMDFDSFTQNVERFEALGLEVQLTEIDLRIEAPITEDKLIVQGEEYKRLMQIALEHNIRVFIVWGISDVHSWVPSYFAGFSSPLLFDGKYEKKPAYDGVIEALKE